MFDYNALHSKRKSTMQICDVCGKRPISGNTIARRGMAKKKGGVGKKITGITRRRFFPNLQRVKALLAGGTVRRIWVCAACIQAGKVRKAGPRNFVPVDSKSPSN
jgi:large subunit ribosomal protein L28